MPYDSWHKLHHREDVQPVVPFRCPVCRQERKVAAHMRKVFLVAERLSRDDKIVSMHDKDLNEELNWKVNYELGILDPFVEDPEQTPGGKHSHANRFYPYKNEHEMRLALRLIFMTENITEITWALWIGTQLDLDKALYEAEESDIAPTTLSSNPQSTEGPNQGGPSAVTSGQQNIFRQNDTFDLTVSPDRASKPEDTKSHELPTPPSSLSKLNYGMPKLQKAGNRQHKVPSPAIAGPLPISLRPHDATRPPRIESYKSLQDFYSLLDKIERTSYVGALFLEAYAEKMRDDMCKSCWRKHNINLDLF
jgi:hypothetical protein